MLQCNASNGYCGTGAAPLYTSDAIGGGGGGWNAHDFDGDGLADVITRSGVPGIAYGATQGIAYGAPQGLAYGGATQGLAYGGATQGLAYGGTYGTQEGLGQVNQGAFLTNTTVGNAIGSCSGQVVQTGTTIQQVNCPTSVPVTEQYSVPRTVQTTRMEIRNRTRMLTKSRQVPETKFRTEVNYVPVRRQVPYQTSRTETYQEPRVETYQVAVPDTRTVMETRSRQRMVPSTKKCNVRVPIYGAKCGGGN